MLLSSISLTRFCILYFFSSKKYGSRACTWATATHTYVGWPWTVIWYIRWLAWTVIRYIHGLAVWYMGWPWITAVHAGQAHRGSGSIREPSLRQMEQRVRDRSAPNRPLCRYSFSVRCYVLHHNYLVCYWVLLFYSLHSKLYGLCV